MWQALFAFPCLLHKKWQIQTPEWQIMHTRQFGHWACYCVTVWLLALSPSSNPVRHRNDVHGWHSCLWLIWLLCLWVIRSCSTSIFDIVHLESFCFYCAYALLIVPIWILSLRDICNLTLAQKWTRKSCALAKTDFWNPLLSALYQFICSVSCLVKCKAEAGIRKSMDKICGETIGA